MPISVWLITTHYNYLALMTTITGKMHIILLLFFITGRGFVLDWDFRATDHYPSLRSHVCVGVHCKSITLQVNQHGYMIY